MGNADCMLTRNRRWLTGFTLIELMVGLAVLAILVVVGVPMMNGFISSNRLTAQANELLSGLQFARSEAIRLNRNVLFCNTSNALTCNVNSGSWNAWLVLDVATNTVLRTAITAHSNIRVQSDTGISQDTVLFNSMGLARNAVNVRLAQTGILRVCDQNASDPNYRDVLFSSGGQVEVIRPSSAGGSCTRPNTPQ